MNHLPNWMKWLIVVVVFGVMAALMLAVNDRAARVDMPEPDTTFGIYKSASETA